MDTYLLLKGMGRKGTKNTGINSLRKYVAKQQRNRAVTGRASGINVKFCFRQKKDGMMLQKKMIQQRGKNKLYVKERTEVCRDGFVLSKKVRASATESAVTRHQFEQEYVVVLAGGWVTVGGVLLYCFNFFSKVESRG